MTDTYQAVPLTTLGLTPEHIDTIKTDHPEFKNIFNTTNDQPYGIPLTLIQNGLEGSKVNTELLITLFNEENIRPEQLFEYCAHIFELANTQPPEQQLKNIAKADALVTNQPEEQIQQELEQLQEHTNNTFFNILKTNYQQKSKELQKNLQYEQPPQEQDVWEINLININGIETEDHTNTKPITIVIEGFIMPDDYDDKTFFDSPALVRVVGEYDYKGLEEGDLFVATPSAFANGEYITNLEN